MANFGAGYFVASDQYLGAESPASAQYFSPSVVTVAANIRYWQRVYDTGTAGWCYYSTLNALNPTPASSATSPNWTGSISTPQVVAAVVVP